MMRLIQLQRNSERRVAVVRDSQLALVELPSVYALATVALQSGMSLAELTMSTLKEDSLDYEAVYAGRSDWRILPAIDHPADAGRVLVSGTGLTHLGSAKNRASMHEKPAADETDSMKMFRWGVEGGKPGAGQIGTAPEWFYKGNGSVLRGHNQALEMYPFAEDGGEEAEIAGVYVIDPAGIPVRIGMTQGNEFSDHVFEKKNYLNLAGSKLRPCAIGPELVVMPQFSRVPGKARVLRGNDVVWEKAIATGEEEMAHSLANIEHHHFKFPGHRRPGDVHVHFFGACALSFGEGVKLHEGDVMEVHFEGFGRALRNPLGAKPAGNALVSVRPIR